MEQLNLPPYRFKFKLKDEKKYIFDSIRRKFVLLTPEEWVRQNFIRYLVAEKNFSTQLMVVEKKLEFNKVDFRADVVVYNRKVQPVLIVECKASSINIHQDHFDQIARYNIMLRVEYLIVTNGISHYCCKIDFKNGSYEFLASIPEFEELQ